MPSKTLIVGPSWIGDMVMAQSLYKLLLGRDPSQRLDVVAPGWSLTVLARMPEVTSCIELAIGHGQLALAERRRIGRRLKAAGYQQAIVLPRSAKAALVPFFAGIPQRVGYRGEMRYGLINDRRSCPAFLDQTVKRFCWLGLDRDERQLPAIPQPVLQQDEANQGRLLEQWQLSTDQPVVALLPGAEYGSAKQWPVDRFRALAKRLLAQDVMVWVLGSERERTLGAEIGRDCTGVKNLCGRTDLVDAIDLLGLCQAVVSNDSGLMHVAAAVGTHVVAIYGSSSPRLTPPLTDRCDIIWLDLDCSPCFQRQCPLNHLNCLRGIEVPTVLSCLDHAPLAS